MFEDDAAYRRVRDSGVLSRELFSRVYGTAPEAVEVYYVDAARGIKVTIPAAAGAGRPAGGRSARRPAVLRPGRAGYSLTVSRLRRLCRIAAVADPLGYPFRPRFQLATGAFRHLAGTVLRPDLRDQRRRPHPSPGGPLRPARAGSGGGAVRAAVPGVGRPHHLCHPLRRRQHPADHPHAAADVHAGGVGGVRAVGHGSARGHLRPHPGRRAPGAGAALPGGVHPGAGGTPLQRTAAGRVRAVGAGLGGARMGAGRVAPLAVCRRRHAGAAGAAGGGVRLRTLAGASEPPAGAAGAVHHHRARRGGARHRGRRGAPGGESRRRGWP